MNKSLLRQDMEVFKDNKIITPCIGKGTTHHAPPSRGGPTI